MADTNFTEDDRELLIRTDERTGRIDRWCFNHDAHHLKYGILAWTVALTALIALAIALIKS